MAEAFARQQGAGRVAAFSAGSRPAAAVNPRTVVFMAERGCDLSTQIPKPLRAFDGQSMDVVVTMGCGDARPWLEARRRVDWDLPDPKTLADDAFRQVRDNIERRVRDLLVELARRPGASA